MVKDGIVRAASDMSQKRNEGCNQQPWKQGKRGNFGCKKGANYKPPPIPNGPIATTVRLACAIRYFAGGSPYNLMAKYDVSHTELVDLVWYIVKAVNGLTKLFIGYPTDHAEQKNIADSFRTASAVDFETCAGAIDGILIWINKPDEKDAKKSGISMAKLYCGRKHKFGLNCQAVANKRGRFLDVSIKLGGSSADCLAFEASDLYRRLESGLLCPGLVIFGDNAYLNSPYLAIPYPNVSSGSKDNYNFYHSQVSRWVGLFILLFILSSNFDFSASNPCRVRFWNVGANVGHPPVSYAYWNYTQENYRLSYGNYEAT